MSETFFIKLGDSLEGSFQNFELGIEYRFQNNLVRGAGSTRFNTDLDASDIGWNGRIADSHRGLLVILNGDYME